MVLYAGSQMQPIMTKECLYMESGVRTTTLESPDFCLNTSNISHSHMRDIAPSASGIKLHVVNLWI